MDNSYKGIYKGFYKKRARKNERQALWTVEARTAIPPTLSRDPSGVRFALSPAGRRGGKTAAADRAQLAQELERTRQELAQARADAQHAAQIAEAGRELMRQELARLTDQVGELKAALYKRAEAPPPAVVVTPSPAG